MSEKVKLTNEEKIRTLFTNGKILSSDIMFVTPEIAKEFLKNSNPNNRAGKHVDRNVKRLVKSMLSGKFKFTHQPAAVDENGMTIDGHCRFKAIVIAGKVKKDIEIPMVIIRNAPLGTYTVLDSGKNRTVADRATEGDRYYTVDAGKASKRALFGMKSTKVIEDGVLLDLVELHEDKLRIMDSFLTGRNRKLRNVARGGVLGAVLRFSYEATPAQFNEVLEILDTGSASSTSENNVDAIIDFINHLNEKDVMTGDYKIYGGGGGVENSLYRKTEVALRSYLDKTQVVAGTSTNTELFPFPSQVNSKHKKLFGTVYGKALQFA